MAHQTLTTWVVCLELILTLGVWVFLRMGRLLVQMGAIWTNTYSYAKSKRPKTRSRPQWRGTVLTPTALIIKMCFMMEGVRHQGKKDKCLWRVVTSITSKTKTNRKTNSSSNQVIQVLSSNSEIISRTTLPISFMIIFVWGMLVVGSMGIIFLSRHQCTLLFPDKSSFKIYLIDWTSSTYSWCSLELGLCCLLVLLPLLLSFLIAM